MNALGRGLDQSYASMGRATLITLSFAGQILFLNSLASAQNRNPIVRASHSRERARELIDEYTNSVGMDGDFDRPRINDRRHSQGQGEVDLKALRPLIRGFADGMKQLTYDLNDQMGQVAGLRQAYTEALRLSASTAAIERRAEKNGVDGAMLDELQQVDADWHELAYRMEAVRTLSGDSRSLIADINDAAKRIRQVIGMQPQLDRRQLNLTVAGLAADLEILQEDIASELGNCRDWQAYRRSISRVRQAALNLITVLRDDRSDTALIVDDYKQFAALWSPLLAKLRSEDDRYIDRDIRRVAASLAEVHQLLLLPKQVDQTQYAYLAKSLKKDIDEFFERTPLILVMHLPNAKQALPVADQFYGACARFVETVNHSQDQGEILDSFRQIELAERAFNDVYREIDSDRAAAVLSRIVQTTNSLRTSLQVQRDDFDGQSADDLAASIQNFTDQIATISKRWLDQDNQPFANECLQETADLADAAARLHDQIIEGRRPPELGDAMTEVYERWRRVYGYIVKCQTEDRPALGRLATALTPAVVDLRAMLIQ